MHWVPEDGRRKRGGRIRHGEEPSKKTWKRWVLAGMEPAGLGVTVGDGDFCRPMLREEHADLSLSKMLNTKAF